jgi:hypothetical protein
LDTRPRLLRPIDIELSAQGGYTFLPMTDFGLPTEDAPATRVVGPAH